MDDDKPKLYSLANRHQLITQVIAGLLIVIIVALATWIWSEFSSSNAANTVNEGLAAAWNWTTHQLSSDVSVARWKAILFLLMFAALAFVTLRPPIRSVLRSPEFRLRLNNAFNDALNDFTSMFGLPRLKVSVAKAEVIEADAPKPDALERREELALQALALGDWLDNEANAKEITDKLASNIHAVELALAGLFEKGYVKDSYHSGYRWFSLSRKGQEYAISKGILKDLDFPF